MAKGYSARNGFGGSAGMMRQQQQMQQKLAKMQQEMESAQKNVEESSFTASVGGGAVQATVSGKKQLTALAIQPDAVLVLGGDAAGPGDLRRQRGPAPGGGGHGVRHGRPHRRAEHPRFVLNLSGE